MGVDKLIYRKITPAEARRRLETERDIVLIDVRGPGEYAQKHIPGSTLIPLGSLAKEVPSRVPDKNRTIFVYCQSGARSKNAANILLKLGYTNVYDMGGIVGWPYEIE
jgi:phage shock protein E